MSSEIVKAEQQGAMEVREQVNQIQYLMKEVLQQGEHYGTVPGCGKKPTLLQPGAEKIAYMFHLVPTYEIKRYDMPGGHREYEIKCTLASRDTGAVVGEGMGTCSTMESKYRYRNKWVRGQKVKEENPDIADTWNTVLKIAKKRSFVAATKSTPAASDIFTQDIEDMPQQYRGQPSPAPQPSPQPPAPQAPAQPARQQHAQPSPLDLYKLALIRARDERGVPCADAMAAVELALGKPREEYDSDDLAAAVAVVDRLGQPEPEYEVVEEQLPLSDDDIPF